MKVRFWGVRGSYPVPGPETVRYGGNTSCVEVRFADNTLVILDLGSGARPLGDHLMNTEFGQGRGRATILLTHTHWDHIMGLPFFEPAQVPGNSFDVYGIARPGSSLQQIFEAQQSVEYFGFPFSDLKADFTFHEVSPGDMLSAGSATITTSRLNHPSYALGYRIVEDQHSLVYVTDTSPFTDVLIEDSFIADPQDAVPEDGSPRRQEMNRYHAHLLRLMRKADVAIYDTFFEPDGYASRPHWGHSTAEAALENAKAVGVKKLAMFHHAPENSDEEMDALGRKYAEAGARDGLEVVVSHEGMELSIP